MTDNHDLHNELVRVASSAPSPVIDGDELLARGRRALRRRRTAASAGAATAVAATVAVAAVIAPDLSSSVQQSQAAAPSAPTSAPSTAKPPAADPSATDQVALQACGDLLTLGGGLKKLTPRPERGPTDLTGWSVPARMSLPEVGTVLVAVSPRRDWVAQCQIPAVGRLEYLGETSVQRIVPARTGLSPHGLGTGNRCAGLALPCTGWLYHQSGRVNHNIVRLHVVARNGHSVDVPVKDGWYAILWADGDPNGQPPARVTAYDAAGRSVPLPKPR